VWDFEHFRHVISVNDTFEQFMGTLLVAIPNDTQNRLVPLAFALVEVENNDNWEWFFHLLRTKLLPTKRKYVLSRIIIKEFSMW
jgi:hypothetical protein